VQAHQLAVARLGWRTRRQVEQGAITWAAVAVPGRIRSLPLASAALGGYWRRSLAPGGAV